MSKKLIILPNGRPAMVPSDISDEALARIRSENAGEGLSEDGNTSRQVAATPRNRGRTRAAIDAAKDRIRASNSRRENNPIPSNIFGFSSGFMDQTRAGSVANFDDEIGGATAALIRGIPRAFREGDVGAISDEYRVNQRALDELKDEYAAGNPGAAIAGQALGGLAMPFGGTGKSAFKVGSALGKVAPRAGKAIQRSAARVRGGGAITRGAYSGAAFGAANAAGESESLADIPMDALEGAGMGAAGGALVGGLVRAGSATKNAITSRSSSEQSVKDVAYRRVNSLIEHVKDKRTGRRLQPSSIRNRILGQRSTGADVRLLDQSAGLRQEAGQLANQNSLAGAEDLQAMAVNRTVQRRNAFAEGVARRATTKGKDARDAKDAINEFRTKQGQVDYRDGGPMDTPMLWSDELQTFFTKAGPSTKKALGRAYAIMRDERRNPEALASMASGKVDTAPSFRTLDYLKRAYDGQIGKSMRSGDREAAGRTSKELSRLKELMVEANPKYGEILAAQRDEFQKIAAIEFGEKVFKRIKSEPRVVLRELKGLKGDELDNARIGIIDQLLNLENKADPFTAMKQYFNSGPQRKILEFAFGGKKQVDSFEKYIKAELSGVESDRFIAMGSGSRTALLQQTAQNQSDAIGEIAGKGAQGYGFGGTVGLAANVVNAVRRLDRMINPNVQEEIARILMSTGEDLERGLAMAAKMAAQRMNKQRNIASTTARPVGQAAGLVAGDN